MCVVGILICHLWTVFDVCCGYSDGLVSSDRQKELMAVWDHKNMKPFRCFKVHSHKESLPKYLKNIHRKRKKNQMAGVSWGGGGGKRITVSNIQSKKRKPDLRDHTVSNIHNQNKKKRKSDWGGGGGG